MQQLKHLKREDEDDFILSLFALASPTLGEGDEVTQGVQTYFAMEMAFVDHFSLLL